MSILDFAANDEWTLKEIIFMLQGSVLSLLLSLMFDAVSSNDQKSKSNGFQLADVKCIYRLE